MEKELIQLCKNYLKDMYDEDTEWINIMKNDVINGTGILSVDCKVVIDGESSEWYKKFHFKNGKVVDMDARRK